MIDKGGGSMDESEDRRGVTLRARPLRLASGHFNEGGPKATIHDALAEAAVGWAGFEAALDQLIWGLSGTSRKTCAAMTAQIRGPVPRLRVILSLLEIRAASKTVLADVNHFLQRTYGIADEVDRVIHDPWLYEHREPGQTSPATMRMAKQPVRDYISFSPEDIKEIGRQIDEHAASFQEIRNRIYDDPSNFLGASRD